MSSQDKPDNSKNDELKKATFFYDSVTKLQEISTKAYERSTKKIDLMLGVLSAAIPVSTAVGYYILDNTFSFPFFILFVSSLVFMIAAMVRGVLLLAPKWFLYVDVKMIMEKYDDEPLSFSKFKVATTWADVIDKNISVINSLYSGLQQMVLLILIGLLLVVLAFTTLGIEMFLMGT